MSWSPSFSQLGISSERHQKEKGERTLKINTYNQRVVTSLRCTNVIGGTCQNQIIVLNSIYANRPVTKCFSEKRDIRGKFKSGKLFGYVQCEIELPENLREAFANFPPFFKNINVGRDDIGRLKKNMPRTRCPWLSLEERLYQIFSFHRSLSFMWTCDFEKIYRFVQYTPVKCFNNFVQSAVNARAEGDENPNSNVVVETMKLPANSS